MILRQAILRHFCQHSFLQWDLQPGLNVVVGPVGAGKSNTFRAIKGSLTGDFESRTMGGKSQDLNYTAPKGANAEVQTTWRLKDGREFTVLRNVSKTGSAKMFMPDGNEFTGVEQAVTDKIQQLTGYSMNTIDTCMFVKQGQVDNIFTFTPARRVDVLIGLTDASIATEADAMLRNYEVVDKHVCSVYDESAIPVLRAKFDKAKSQVKFKQACIRDFASRLLEPETYSEIKEMISDHDKREKELSNLKELKTERDSKIKAVNERLERLKESAKRRDEAELLVRRKRDELDKLSEAYRDYLTQQNAYNNYARCKAVLESPPPKAPEALEDDAELLPVDMLTQLIAKHTAVITAYERKICEACSRPFNVPKADYDASVSVVKNLRGLVAKRKAQDLKHEEFRQAYAVYKAALKNWQQDVDKARLEISTFEERDKVKPVEVIKPDTSELKTLEAALNEAADNHRKESDLHKKAEQELAVLESRVADSQTRLRDMPLISTNTLLRLESTLKKAKVDQEAYDQLQQELSRLKSDFAMAAMTLRSANAEKRKMSKVKPRLEVIAAARKILQKLPSRTVAEVAARMENTINQKLGEIGMDFTLSVDTDLEFLVSRHGNQFPHTRMSGGQKCASGLAFWLTVAEVMGLETMFLDEPIAGFDESGIADLPDMLLRVDAMCRRQGKQIVLITHHTELMHLGHQLKIG